MQESYIVRYIVARIAKIDAIVKVGILDTLRYNQVFSQLFCL